MFQKKPIAQIGTFVSIVFAISISAWIFILNGCNTGTREGLGPGDKPPDVDLTDLSGKPAALKDFQGKVILLNFWASWCAPCLDEMPELEKLYQEMQARGFTVVAVGVEDSPEELTKIKEQYRLTFPILVDAQGKAKSRYRLAGFPESFLIGRDGKLAMVLDPTDSSPVVRIIGPRSWSGASARAQIEALLGSVGQDSGPS